ncbi:MAG: hypothetical protein SFU86_20720 [Pirellulaceae bacterium]|nr:hypothetical protein [Pirellulaceae bacterium]
MKNIFPWLGVLIVSLCLAGCGSSGAPRGPITGQVTVGGQPLKSGRILFLPLAPNQGPTASAMIVDGQYNLSDLDGPVAGPNRVELEGDPAAILGFALDDEEAFAKRGGRPLPPDPIPPAFNRQSSLVAEVQADEPNTFDIAVPGRTVAARPSH